MDTARIAREMASLPPEAQRQIMAFVATLKARYVSSSQTPNTARKALQDEPFIGIWQDRDDMQDSSAWVRSQRRWESVR